MCINAAVELILLMEWVHRTRSDALPEPWYTIFCKFALRLTYTLLLSFR